MFKKTVLLSTMASLALIATPDTRFAKEKKDRVARDFRHADLDGDRKLSLSEWHPIVRKTIRQHLC